MVPILTFRYLEIDTMCYSGQENLLTPKKSLLVLNAGTALIYWSVYESVWQECPLGSKSKAAACHIYNSRKKFHQISPRRSFTFRAGQIGS